MQSPIQSISKAFVYATCLADRGKDYVSRKVGGDEAVYRSESETGHRNRAIAWMLENFGIIEGDPMTTLFRDLARRLRGANRWIAALA